MTTGIVTINEIQILELDFDPSVSGQAASIGSLAILDGEAKIWQKYGVTNTSWILVNNGRKAGIVAHTSFSGNPKKYTVTFTTAYANTNYAINISSVDNRLWSYESKTTTGFILNSNAKQALTAEVTWSTTYTGEGL